jgi:hypothetical protein
MQRFVCKARGILIFKSKMRVFDKQIFAYYVVIIGIKISNSGIIANMRWKGCFKCMNKTGFVEH